MAANVRWAPWLCGIILALSSAQASADQLTGCWEGTWQSCTDQFKGTVKARIKHCGGNRYEAVFTGRAFKIMPYRYKAKITAWTDPESGAMRFKSSSKLPFWGCHWMNGTSDGCKFTARYHTDDHVGYFHMRRVCCK